MIYQCKDCEFSSVDDDGRRTFACDPYTNIKEPACIAKWQLFRLNEMVSMQRKIWDYLMCEDVDRAKDYWKFN